MYFYVYVCGCVCDIWACRDQRITFGSQFSFLACGFQGLNWGCQLWWQASLPGHLTGPVQFLSLIIITLVKIVAIILIKISYAGLGNQTHGLGLIRQMFYFWIVSLLPDTQIPTLNQSKRISMVWQHILVFSILSEQRWELLLQMWE